MKRVSAGVASTFAVLGTLAVNAISALGYSRSRTRFTLSTITSGASLGRIFAAMRRLPTSMPRAVQRGWGRLEWSVLDWNEPSIAFYKKMGATPMDEWTVFRLAGEPLQKLAGR